VSFHQQQQEAGPVVGLAPLTTADAMAPQHACVCAGHFRSCCTHSINGFDFTCRVAVADGAVVVAAAVSCMSAGPLW